MEEPDTSQYTDIETVEREWSAQEIYRSLVMRSEGEDGLLIPAAGLEDSSILRPLLERLQMLDGDDIESAILNQATDPYVEARENERRRFCELLKDSAARTYACSWIVEPT